MDASQVTIGALRRFAWTALKTSRTGKERRPRSVSCQYCVCVSRQYSSDWIIWEAQGCPSTGDSFHPAPRQYRGPPTIDPRRHYPSGSTEASTQFRWTAKPPLLRRARVACLRKSRREDVHPPRLLTEIQASSCTSLYHTRSVTGDKTTPPSPCEARAVCRAGFDRNHSPSD
jgi:hypothetical protein